MRSYILGKLLILIVLVGFFSPVLNAEDTRSIPLDMYLIIDGSTALENSKSDAIAWINNQIIDRILIEGDNISIWAAGDTAQMIFSGTISDSDGKKGIKDKLLTLDTEGNIADFAGAIREVSTRVSQTPQTRMAYTMLITASAEGLRPVLSGGSQSLLRWFRSERYERWQVLILAPDIGTKVQQAAANYMNAFR
jgi:hypothetical protein